MSPLAPGVPAWLFLRTAGTKTSTTYQSGTVLSVAGGLAEWIRSWGRRAARVRTWTLGPLGRGATPSTINRSAMVAAAVASCIAARNVVVPAMIRMRRRAVSPSQPSSCVSGIADRGRAGKRGGLIGDRVADERLVVEEDPL